MGRIRSASNSADLKICVKFFVVFVALLLQQLAHGTTNIGDVAAINSLYAAFGSPPLPGWVSAAGDPCGQAWQGVLCDTSNNIKSINLVGANLGGGLGDSLGSFSSLQSIDLSNNRLGGSIPTSLPITLLNLFLSGNNFTGSIPSSLSTLTQLSALKLNNNQLTGEIPDAFVSLAGVSSIDLCSNNLSGELPPSMASLSALASLHLQSNQLSGPLDVLEDLPLQDLDIRNNLFSGPIPDKLLAIPNFKKDGNPFNITTTSTPLSPSPSTSSPATTSSPPPPGKPSPTGSPPRSGSDSSSPPGQRPSKQADGPSSQAESGGSSKSSHKKKIVLISICSVMGFIILILALLVCLPSCFSKSRDMYHTYRQDDIPPPYKTLRENAPHSASAIQPSSQIEDVEKGAVVAKKDAVTPEVRRIAAVPKPVNHGDSFSQRRGKLRKQDSEMSDVDISIMVPPPPPPSPPPPSLAERVIVAPIAPVEPAIRNQHLLTSVKSFTIASLQQYTNSFSQDNLLGNGMLGTVYKAEFPNGKLLAVKKLDKGVCSKQKDYEFIELVNSIDRLRHANIIELEGYCMEHGQRLLVYEYCGNGTLLDALQSEEYDKKQLLWITRMRMALDSARALEYLHEICEPPVIHRNFKSTNILLDDLSVRVSDCGLTPLIASGSVSQLSGHLMSTYGYGAPEFESGMEYTTMSDVYSFGVVMLELLTGRLSYDGERSRGEQSLVRWAIPQLHDIDALTRMVDPSLEGEYPVKSLSHFADIISRCVQSEPEFRPLMSEVVQDLQSMLQKGSPTKPSSLRG